MINADYHRCMYCTGYTDLHHGRMGCAEAYELAHGAGIPVDYTTIAGKKYLTVEYGGEGGGLCEGFDLMPHEDLAEEFGPEIADAAHGVESDPCEDLGLTPGVHFPGSLGTGVRHAGF